MIPDNVGTPKFYLLPKIHKKNNPGRPVISSIDCHTSRISEYVDHCLQPHVKHLKSFVKDTTHFLNLIEEMKPIPAGSYLVTMDVRSLYTNIPHEEGIKAVEETIKTSSDKSKTTMISTLLRLILMLNNFVFNEKNYLQIKGCAMGTKCAPTYANIFMGQFEEKKIFPLMKNFCILYKRYIDDIFIVWTGTKEQFEAMMEIINSCHASIKFDYEISIKEVNFLDTTVYVNKDNRLKTRLYVKPTDRQSYLHRKSEHPRSLKNSIAYGQALRIKKICSENKDYQSNVQTLRKAFLKRGYNEDQIQRQVSKANAVSRPELLKNRQRETDDRIPLVVTYNRTLPDIQSILKKHWHILQLEPTLKECFKNPPILAFRRNKNVGDMLKKTTKEQKCGHSKPCTINSRYKCCKQMTDTSSFKSQQTGKVYKIYNEADCKSKKVIYLLECTKCRLQYVGKSEPPFHFRMAQYRSDIKKPNSIEAAKHFQTAGHDFTKHGRFIIIEKIEKELHDDTLTIFMEKREDFWMSKLKTIHPLGLNKSFNHPQWTTGIMK